MALEHMMKNLLYYDIKRNFPIRRMIITILIIWMAIFFFANFFAQDMSSDRLLKKLSIGIVDNDKSTLSNMLLANFVNNKQFSSMMELTIGDESELTDSFNANELTAMVNIPKGFTDGLMHYRNLPLDVTINPSQPLKAMILLEVFDSYSDYIESVDASTLGAYQTLSETDMDKKQLSKINDLFSMQMVTFALGRNNFFDNNIIHTFPATSSLSYFIASMLCLGICFLSTGIIFSIYNDFSSFCIHRYATHSNNFYIFTASKLLSFTIVISLIMSLVSLPLILWLSISIKSMFLLIFQLLIFSVFFTSVFMLIGTLLFSESSAALFCNMSIFLLGLLGGNFIPLSLMPKMIQNISMFTPNYHIIQNLLYNIENIQPLNIKLLSICLIISIICYIISSILIKNRVHKGGILS